MNRLTGTATLDYRGVVRQVQVCLDLDENVIELLHTTPNFVKAMSIITNKDWDKSPAILTNINIVTPIGIITKDSLNNFYITSYSPGSYSIPDSILTRILTLHKKEEGVTRILLHPRSSGVSFKFQPFDALSPNYELFLRGAKGSKVLPQPIELELNPGKVVIVQKDHGITVKCDQPLSDKEEILRLSIGILHGGPVTIQSILEDTILTINLAAHEGRSIGPLYINDKDVGELLQKIINYLSTISPTDYERWKVGIYFYLQGLGGIAPLEIRAINLFTYLEIIDNRGQLEKTSIAPLLGLTIDEADLVCRTRNNLIHNGYSIGASLLAAEKSISDYKSPLENTVFYIDREDKDKTGIKFFLTFAGLLNKLLVTRTGFIGEWNNYSKYEL